MMAAALSAALMLPAFALALDQRELARAERASAEDIRQLADQETVGWTL